MCNRFLRAVGYKTYFSTFHTSKYNVNTLEYLKREFVNFFLLAYLMTKYDIMWTENSDVIDRSLPKKLKC